ncbi:MAG: DinB family protein, partial [Gemmatimonadaceae bacterium]
MIITIRRTLTATVMLATLSASAAAQQRAGLMGDLMKDVKDVQGKLIGLAKAVPVTKYTWRPGTGVRSVGEVFLHVAADNYVMPWGVGVPPDAATGIKMNDFQSVGTFEKQELDQKAMVAAIEKSFAHLLQAMSDTPDAKLNDH